jgi:WXG100 family type VII secretion target
MGLLKVTSEQLMSTSQSVKTGSDQVQQELTALRNLVAPLAADWEGAASASFQQLWQEWETGARQIQEALMGISTLLGHAGQTYQTAEDSVKSSMAQ